MRLPPHPAFDTLRFAEGEPGPVLRWLVRLLRAAQRPGEARGVLAAALAGKRVRARDRAAILWGARHALHPPPIPPGEAEAVPGLRVATPDAIRRDGAGPAGIVVLTAPGHRLLPGAPTAIADAFAADAELGALYGDAVVLGPEGRPLLPVLRPAFDPDYLLAADYLGPVVAVRRALLDRLGLDPALPGAETADLLLRLAAEGGGVRHLPRPLSTWAPVEAAPPDAWVRSRRALAERRLAGAGRVEAQGGIVSLRRDLPAPPLATVIVPTRDRVELLRACIESIRAHTDWPELELIVCDNDSRHPRTLAYLRRLEDEGVRVMPCPGPFNFAAMNNRAAAQARGALLVFVNNDVAAFRDDWLRRMAEEALRPEVGAVGAKLLDARGRIQHGGIVLGTGGLVTHAHRHFPGAAPGYLASLQATHRVSAVTAACLAVESEKFRAVGGFDEAAFAVDFNDVDLCLRLEAGGWRTLMVPGAVLHHHEAASRRWNPEARERHEAEVARLRARWGARLDADPWYHPGFDPRAGTHVRLRRWDGAGPR
ncbi:glycosyltransferase family 2 protein [Methylobacterium platani]|uniref:Glycosyl transferase n=2 Tax=Methylobacterium platani TaxID=427683 RepID=A0A179SH71_9HYPH|nr:glycosyltransferase family 2 protein [Methylobacterium platani]KMO14709.1 glycosyl transferase [Methylobacterium platani JCM 14648]OAS26220.1 glycosyl transferase [Methylobacterium platani]